jgi:cytosine permease
MIIEKLKHWWRFDAEAEQASADNPITPLTDEQRRDTLPLLTMAFGWGFLITGLMVGGALGAGVSFWPDLIYVSFLGNITNFVIGSLVGYIGYKTACNSGLLYKLVYGKIGAYFPVLLLALVLICWQGIVVGAFGFAWAQDFNSFNFYAVAIGAGILFTWTTYYGVRGLELVSAPSVVILVIVGVYAAYTQISQAGGMQEFLELSKVTSANNPLSNMDAINIVIGSWIVGAIVMPEYTRFAKKAWVAIAIPFIVMIIAQWFLQIIGSAGGIVSGQFDFTTYMRLQGVFVAGLGLIGMSLALWTTGDANLYLPVIQTSSILRRPQRVMTVICGVLGTIVGLVIYQHFIQFVDKLAILLPPLIGPVIAHFYIVKRGNFDIDKLNAQPRWNIAALLAYIVGASSKWWLVQDLLVSSLAGLLISIVAYLIMYYLITAMGANRKEATASK